MGAVRDAAAGRGPTVPGQRLIADDVATPGWPGNGDGRGGRCQRMPQSLVVMLFIEVNRQIRPIHG